MAQGVAWAARELGVPATVIAPESAPQTKLDAIERLGGTVVKVPYERWWEIMLTSQFDEAEGFFVHPVQNERVMAGNGTIGLELAEDLPDADAVLVPWGGGGLFTGIASALAALRPETHVYAVQPDTGAAVTAALEAGEPREAEFQPSFVDGAGAKVVLPAMWERARPLLAGAYTVTLDETAAAVRLLAERARVVAEGAGALARRGRGFGPGARTEARLHCLGRQHRRRPAGDDPRGRDAGLGRVLRLADERQHEPDESEEPGGQRGHDGGDGPLEDHVGDEEDDGGHPEREEDHPDDREDVGDLKQRFLVAVAEADPVVRARRDQEDGAGQGAEQRDHERVALQVGRLPEPLRKRDGEQERKQHLDARERHAQLVEELDQLPVDPLLVRLLRHSGGE